MCQSMDYSGGEGGSWTCLCLSVISASMISSLVWLSNDSPACLSLLRWSYWL